MTSPNNFSIAQHFMNANGGNIFGAQFSEYVFSLSLSHFDKLYTKIIVYKMHADKRRQKSACHSNHSLSVFAFRVRVKFYEMRFRELWHKTKNTQTSIQPIRPISISISTCEDLNSELLCDHWQQGQKVCAHVLETPFGFYHS